MKTHTVSCPHCQFSREVPLDKLPSVPVKATCPGCKQTFMFDPAASVVPPVNPPQLPPQPPQPPQPQPAVPPGPEKIKEAPPRSVPPRKPPPPKMAVRPSATMIGIGELLSASWTLFQKRFAPLFALYLLSLLLVAAGAAIPAVGGILLAKILPFGAGGVAAIGALGGILLGGGGMAWGCAALIAAALDDNLCVRDALQQTKSCILPMAWVLALVSFVIGGGFLLFIIPGIIFSVWFFMAPFLLVDEDVRGVSTLLKSRALVQGRWFDVFLRLVVIWACSAVAGAIPVAGPVMVLISVPYVMIYQTLLYKNIKEVAPSPVYNCSLSDTLRWPAIALVGYIALPALLIATFGVAVLGQFKQFAGTPGQPVVISVTPSETGGQTTVMEGDLRVIPIPPAGGAQNIAAPSAPPPGQETSAAGGGATLPEKSPENIHIFIYAVNSPGRVLANGIEIKQIESKENMQYNYNLSGDKLRYGENSIEVEYNPMPQQGTMLKPEIHLKISSWGKGPSQVLGDWRISETSAGRKTFNFDIPKSPGDTKP